MTVTKSKTYINKLSLRYNTLFNKTKTFSKRQIKRYRGKLWYFADTNR